MARSSSSEIRDVVSDFVGRLSALIESDAVVRARDAILSAFGGQGGGTGRGRGRPPGRGPGRPPGSSAKVGRGVAVVGRKRRKAPIQLCPVPGCQNRAAPVFGMVCSKHKDMPKAEIRKFREARRAQGNQPKAQSKKAAKAA